MMWTGRKLLAALGLVGAFGLGGCAYDDGYGYGGVSVGTGYYGGGAYDPYWGNGYGPGLGWYDGFYYPGSGYYVYDRGGRRQRWNDSQRRYWEARRNDRRGDGRGRDWRGRDGRPGWRDGQAVRPGRPEVAPGAQAPRPRWGERRGDGRRDWNRDQNRPGWRDRGASTPTQRPEGGTRWRGRSSSEGAAGTPRAQSPRSGSPRFGGDRGGGRNGGRDQRRGN